MGAAHLIYVNNHVFDIAEWPVQALFLLRDDLETALAEVEDAISVSQTTEQEGESPRINREPASAAEPEPPATE